MQEVEGDVKGQEATQPSGDQFVFLVTIWLAQS